MKFQVLISKINEKSLDRFLVPFLEKMQTYLIYHTKGLFENDVDLNSSLSSKILLEDLNA